MILPWLKTEPRLRLSWRWLILPILLLTWGEFVKDKVLQAPTPDPRLGTYWPDSGYWVAARLAWEGQPAAMYDDAAFQAAARRLLAYPNTFAANLPTTALVFLPWAPLSSRTAIRLWVPFSLGCFLLAWLLLLGALRVGVWGGLGLSALVPLFEPWRLDMRLGQMYGVLLLLAVGAALALVRGAGPERVAGPRPWTARLLAGVLLGILCIAKLYYGAVLLLPALLRRQGTVVATAGGVFGAAAGATILWWGPGLWTTALPISLNWRLRPETAIIAYQSLNNFLMRFFHQHPDWNPRPIIADLPDLVTPLWWGLALGILGLSLWALWPSRAAGPKTVAEQLLQPALAIPVALLLAPISVSYHFVLALFPLLVAGAVLRERRGRPALWGMLGAAAFLIGADLPYNTPDVFGADALLHYPRLYGTLLLWVLIVVLLRSRPQPTTVQPIPGTPATQP
jgi:hypothetical protein